jgi:hypothetical protein
MLFKIILKIIQDHSTFVCYYKLFYFKYNNFK